MCCRADVYRLDRFLSRPRVWSSSVSTAELRFPGVAAVMVLLRWRIMKLLGDGGESCAFVGDSFVRFVTSFGATGEWIFLFGCDSGGVLVRPVEGLFFRMVGVVAGCCGFRFRVTGIEPRRQFLRRLSSIYFGEKVADVRS